MAHGETDGEALEKTSGHGDEMTEEAFLKDLYLYMKNRDTPIERVPHLGFKQIDLFMMYQTVKDLGGYHQVTAQQLWKQVYNTLGGNPRSTSAATCTRRHYEKLLLPYECYVKGGKIFPHEQTTESQRPTKRRYLPVHNPNNLMPDLHARVMHMHVPYPHYYPQSSPAHPPFVPISQSVLIPPSPPTMGSPFGYHPSPQTPAEGIKQPLQHLRYLAEQYKSTSGLTEPLNLSLKVPSGEAKSQPPSSFSAPPKFLNEPSPLYPLKKRSRDESCEAQSGDSDEEGSGFSIAPISFGHKEAFELDTLSTASASTSFLPASTLPLNTDSSYPTSGVLEDMSTLTYAAGSPKTTCTGTTYQKAEREESANQCQSPPSLNQLLASPLKDNKGKMEIQIPLSLLHDLIRMYSSSTSAHEGNRRSSPAEDSRERSWCSSNKLTSNMASLARDQDRHFITQDVNAMQSKVSSSTSAALNASDYIDRPRHFPSSYPWEQQDLPHKLKTISGAQTRLVQNLLSSKSQTNTEDMSQHKVERTVGIPPAVLTLNSGSGSLLHLTSEELMKLKKIISSLS